MEPDNCKINFVLLFYIPTPYRTHIQMHGCEGANINISRRAYVALILVCHRIRKKIPYNHICMRMEFDRKHNLNHNLKTSSMHM